MNLRLLFLSLIALALAACASPRELPKPGPGWQTWRGQLRYSTPQRSVIGEVLVAKDGPQNLRLEFTAGPGVPLISLQKNATAQNATGILARGPSSRLQGWWQLGAKLSAMPSPPERLAVEYPPAGERFELVFRQ